MVTQRTLVRGGHVLSMDPDVGALARGDVLVEDGVIVAVAPSLGEVDAEVIDVAGYIVAPGLVDTHRHTWQTQMRALCTDWTLTDYLFGIRFSVSPAYTPADVHLGNLLGAVDALESGVTTILDFSHCNNTPEHADAAVTGLLDAGVRAVFGYGFFESSPMAPPHFTEHGLRLADFAGSRTRTSRLRRVPGWLVIAVPIETILLIVLLGRALVTVVRDAGKPRVPDSLLRRHDQTRPLNLSQ